jgi:archaetidylinositol phosphate synthase
MLKQAKAALGMQERIGRALAIIPLSPNQWTILSLIVAMIAGLVVALFSNLPLGLSLFALAGLMDLVDGAVARARNEASAFGGFLDGVCDRFVEAAFLFSFMFVPLPSVFGIDSKIWLASLVFLGTCMPSFIRAYADYKGVIKREDADALGGVFERGERIGMLVLGLAAGIALSMQWFVYALALGSALSLITIIQRLLSISALRK